VAEFDGLSGSAKQTKVLDACGLKRAPLSSLAAGNALNEEVACRLLAAMKQHSKPVKPKHLGAIGKESLKARFEGLGIQPESFTYKLRYGETDGIPWVQETAFSYCPEAEGRRLVTGVNWSLGILNPFRELGRFGRNLDDVLSEIYAGPNNPIVLFLH